MADSNPKSYLRDGCGPRAVESGREKNRSSSRRDDDKSRPKHSSSRISSSESNKLSSHRRKSSSTTSAAERPVFELDVIGQPARSIVFGQTVEASVMVSLRCPSTEMTANCRNIDTTCLMGVVSLIADSRSGERVPVECGTLSGQNMFDSVHQVPQAIAESLSRSQPCRLSLGYVKFPLLLIRRPGLYRLRITLIRMGSGSLAGGSSLVAIDSDPIKVDQRNCDSSGSGRKHGRS